MTDERQTGGCVTWLAAALLLFAIAYVPSSGPVLAAAFWLREATGWDGFYAAIWLYFPLFAFGRFPPLDAYIEWWVEFFGTVGPG
jgi:hypothetical protein